MLFHLCISRRLIYLAGSGPFILTLLVQLSLHWADYLLRLAEDDRAVCLAGVAKPGGKDPCLARTRSLLIIDEAQKPKVHVHALAGDEGSSQHSLRFRRAGPVDIVYNEPEKLSQIFRKIKWIRNPYCNNSVKVGFNFPVLVGFNFRPLPPCHTPGVYYIIHLANDLCCHHGVCAHADCKRPADRGIVPRSTPTEL